MKKNDENPTIRKFSKKKKEEEGGRRRRKQIQTLPIG
jgi:hypothetical protein